MFYQRFVSSDNKKYAIPTESEVTSAPVLDLLRFKVDRHDFNFVNSYRSLLDNISALSLREDRVQNLLMLALHLIDKLSVFWCQWETESSNSTRNSINGYFGILLAITLSPNLFRVERSALFLDLQKVVNDFVDRDSNSSHLQKKKPVQYFVIEKICQSDDAVIEALTVVLLSHFHRDISL
jgi:hypothetical protein